MVLVLVSVNLVFSGLNLFQIQKSYLIKNITDIFNISCVSDRPRSMKWHGLNAPYERLYISTVSL